MSLFGTIKTASTGLQTSQIGLQVVGNNIANANSPGYIRQRLNVVPTVATRKGTLLLGQGAISTGVTQIVDKALMERMFAAGTSLAAGEILNRAYTDVELLVGSLDGSGLPELMSSFNNALHDLSATPNDRALRDFVVLRGEALANELRSTYQTALTMQAGINEEVGAIANAINRNASAIARLNVEISTAEGGGVIGSDAGGLREQRYALIEELAGLVDLKIQEQPTGAISLFIGGEYLVTDGLFRDVKTAYSDDAGGFEIRLVQTDSPLQTRSGRYGALMEARHQVYGKFLNDIDSVAQALIQTVNAVHTQGQGRRGFDQVVSTESTAAGVPLRDLPLKPLPENGSFEIHLTDASGEPISTKRIQIRALNQVGDSTVDSVVADINAVDGITARINSEGKLVIASDAPGVSFSFANDTSGFLAAMGLNTFFTGDSASTININPTLMQSSDYLAVSSGGIGRDTDTLMEMVDLIDRPLESLQGRSVRRIFDENVAVLAQRISLQRSVTQGAADVHAGLNGQHLGITGVNIDEESIHMLALNRAFQAGARVINTANEMLEILMRL